jgi:hypothetical protein
MRRVVGGDMREESSIVPKKLGGCEGRSAGAWSGAPSVMWVWGLRKLCSVLTLQT